MTFWGGSGSGSSDPCFWLMDPDPDTAIFVIDLQDASKKLIFNTIFSAYYFLKVHLHHFSKIKSQKESQNRRNQGFSYYFCLMIEGSGSGAGFGSTVYLWLVDPDPDPGGPKTCGSGGSGSGSGSGSGTLVMIITSELKFFKKASRRWMIVVLHNRIYKVCMWSNCKCYKMDAQMWVAKDLWPGCFVPRINCSLPLTTCKKRKALVCLPVTVCTID